jgi:hypothetical protein
VQAFLTFHAVRQISNRLSLDWSEVVKILDDGLFIPIGSESPNKIHKLFWSEPDSACFVAIQDESNGEVITVLPINYHNRWVVAPDVQVKAKRLITGEDDMSDVERPSLSERQKSKLDVGKLSSRPGISLPQIFKLDAYLYRVYGGYSRRIELGKVPMNDRFTIDEFMDDPEAIPMIREMISKRLTEGEWCDAVGVSIGRKGVSIRVNIPRIDFQQTSDEDLNT